MDFALIKLALLTACSDSGITLPPAVHKHLTENFPGQNDFEEVHTGGGCMALTCTMKIDGALYTLALTQADDWAIGLYEGDWIGEGLLICVCCNGTVSTGD
ncbi:hypothetical protein FHR99_003187 [Litorivivens lipolytica]|uniref:Uncharacterized protein n=1 Tax=Litorivivens lipolytica TaxID=1524264 RepID=A0A7W4W8G5_9GAMM|nr:hypothetical protein [Litorivivens lipolytica]MBB3048913.1 hypothetical protein [Litorivivens lipolytica]